MSPKTKPKCLHCNDEYCCDPRNFGRQKYCAKPDCRRASKAASQRQWLSRPENRDYFRGAENSERVRLWRLANPGFRRNKRTAPKSVLQEPLIPQAVENKEVAQPDVSSVLQDICLVQPALVVGLISIMTGSGLQEDIVASARWYINRGEDILRMVPGRSAIPSHENQANPVPGASAARPPPIQLDRPTPRA
jgi:hypothetical protein